MIVPRGGADWLFFVSDDGCRLVERECKAGPRADWTRISPLSASCYFNIRLPLKYSNVNQREHSALLLYHSSLEALSSVHHKNINLLCSLSFCACDFHMTKPGQITAVTYSRDGS